MSANREIPLLTKVTDDRDNSNSLERWLSDRLAGTYFRLSAILELVRTTAAKRVRPRTDFYYRQRKYDSNLRDSTAYTKFRRNTEFYKPHTILISLQPWPAIFAFIGCTVVFAFCSATWWYSKVTAPKVLIAYAAQFVVLLIFLVLKAIRYRRHGTFKSNRPIRGNFNGFTARLNDLVRFIKKPSNSSTPLTNLQSSNATSGNQATGFAARHLEQNREAGVEARAAGAPLR